MLTNPTDGGSLPKPARGYGLHSLLYFWCDLPDPGLATEILEVLREKIRGIFKEYIEAETQLLALGVWDLQQMLGERKEKKVWRRFA